VIQSKVHNMTPKGWTAPEFTPRAFAVLFVVDEVTIRKNFPEYFGFHFSVIILPIPHFHSSIIWKMSLKQSATAVTR